MAGSWGTRHTARDCSSRMPRCLESAVQVLSLLSGEAIAFVDPCINRDPALSSDAVCGRVLAAKVVLTRHVWALCNTSSSGFGT